MPDKKSVFIRSYGCQMNVYDSERMAAAMSASGYERSASQTRADLIVLNTCHIREKATEKIYSELGRLKQLKARNPDLRIAVAGCVAQAEGEEILRRQPLVDIVVGPQAYHRLPELVARARNGEKAVDTSFPREGKFDFLPDRGRRRGPPTAFLTVQEGCDKFCTFCVVPYTRGVEFSRPVGRILGEAQRLVDRGTREITLLGQNVNAYHGTGPDGREWSLAELIWAMSDIDGLERIRFTTSHPNDMSDDLIEAHGACRKLMPYLHLPVQSGSDRILKAMNRRHTAGSYVRLIERIRRARPDIAISGDFIVGFPGETESDFAMTLKLVEEVGYSQAYSFKYSPRPGTPAAEREQVPADIGSRRLQELQSLLRKQQREAQESRVGQVLDVLFEKRGRLAGQLVGKSQYLNAVHADVGPDMIGEIAKVKIIRAEPNSLAGETIEPSTIPLNPGRQAPPLRTGSDSECRAGTRLTSGNND